MKPVANYGVTGGKAYEEATATAVKPVANCGVTGRPRQTSNFTLCGEARGELRCDRGDGISQCFQAQWTLAAPRRRSRKAGNVKSNVCSSCATTLDP